MAISYKVVSKKPGLSSETLYYPMLTGRRTADLHEICAHISKRSSFSPADVIGVVHALIEAIPNYLSEGRNVRLGGLGTFSVHASAKGKTDPDKVTARDIDGVKMSFLPDKQIKAALSTIEFVKVK